MPNLLVLAAVGAGAYLGYRWIRHQVREAAAAAAKETVAAQREAPRAERARDAGDLVWDEEAGVYRKKD